VPLFFYVVHWYVLHLMALALAWLKYGRFDFLFGLPPSLLPFSVVPCRQFGSARPSQFDAETDLREGDRADVERLQGLLGDERDDFAMWPSLADL
jgi:hypothetical protein